MAPCQVLVQHPAELQQEECYDTATNNGVGPRGIDQNLGKNEVIHNWAHRKQRITVIKKSSEKSQRNLV